MITSQWKACGKEKVTCITKHSNIFPKFKLVFWCIWKGNQNINDDWKEKTSYQIGTASSTPLQPTATPGYNCALTAWAEPQSTDEELDLVHVETDDNVMGIC